MIRINYIFFLQKISIIHIKDKKTALSRFNNSDFNRGGSKLKELLWIMTSSLFFQSSFSIMLIIKPKILRIFSSLVGKKVIIKPKVNIKFPWKLSIGDHTWIGENVWIDNLAQVKIGNNVCISQGAMLLTGNHNYKKTTFDLMTREIIIEDGAWIGAKSIVCPGIKVGSHAILTVGSVAASDLEPYGIYQGNPARKIRQRIIE